MPIYNSAKFLDESITTILNTETDHFELILVNDGSTDSSALISEKYRKIDNRVRYVEQKNGGVSSARNTGLKNALGEYIWFIDSDDLVVNTEIIDIIRLLKNGGDIIYAKHANIGDEVARMDFIYDNAELHNKLCDEMTNYLFGILQIGWEVWDKIYRRDFLFDNNIYFDRRWIQYEDGDFNLVASSLAKKCVGYNREIYLHRKDNFESLISLRNNPYYHYRGEYESIFTLFENNKLSDSIEMLKCYCLYNGVKTLALRRNL